MTNKEQTIELARTIAKTFWWQAECPLPNSDAVYETIATDLRELETVLEDVLRKENDEDLELIAERVREFREGEYPADFDQGKNDGEIFDEIANDIEMNWK